MTSKLVNELALRDILNKSRTTIRKWRLQGIIKPIYSEGVGVHSRYIYRLSDVKKSLIKNGKVIPINDVD